MAFIAENANIFVCKSPHLESLGLNVINLAFLFFAENCEETCDPWLCWPLTKAGQNTTQPCPQIKGTLENGRFSKFVHSKA